MTVTTVLVADVGEVAGTGDVRALAIELITTSTSPTSVSARLLARVGEALEARGVLIGWTDRRELGDVDAGQDVIPEQYEDLRRRVEAADAVILAHGIHGFSVPGPTKTLADVIGSAFVGKPFTIVTAAGSSRSHLAIRDLACSIVLEHESPWIPLTVQVTPDPVEEDIDPVDNPDTLSRVDVFAAGFVHYATRLAGVTTGRGSS